MSSYHDPPDGNTNDKLEMVRMYPHHIFILVKISEESLRPI